MRSDLNTNQLGVRKVGLPPLFLPFVLSPPQPWAASWLPASCKARPLVHRAQTNSLRYVNSLTPLRLTREMLVLALDSCVELLTESSVA